MGNTATLPATSAGLTARAPPDITYDGHRHHRYPADDKLQRKVYDGEWENGRRNGKGTLEWTNGAVYSGLWKDDTLCGLGAFLLPATGIHYEGEFLENQFHGSGVLWWVEGGRRYEGDWKESKHHGFGMLRFADMDARQRLYYRGEWCEGKRNGYGIMEWRTGAKYEGDWLQGKREGRGKQTFAGGEIHIGAWEGAKRHGPGVRYFTNGDKLVGSWKHDKKHGLCEYHYAHGRVEERLYVNGRRQQESIPQPVPSLAVLCIEAIGKRKALAQAAEELMPEELAAPVRLYRQNHPSRLASVLSDFFSNR